MIAKSTNPLSPDVNILIDGVEVDYTSIMGFTMLLDEGKHDMCTIRMSGIQPQHITDYINAAVRVSISNGNGRRQEFCGYVAFVEPTSTTRSGLVNRSPFQTADIVCMGASWYMTNDKSTVWENTSIGILAQTMANRYGFSLDIATDPFAYPRLLQQEESDWAFLVRVADMYGYRVTLHGTHMHVWDPFQALGRRPSFARLTTLRKNVGSVPGVIMSFNGTFGLVTPDGSSSKYTVASMDNQGSVMSISSDSISQQSWTGLSRKSLREHYVGGTAQSPEEANRQLSSLLRKSHAFHAEVEVTAGAGIVPGGIVEVTEYKSEFDGMWYVTSVQHDMGASQYVTRLCLSRDFNDDNDFLISRVQLADEPPSPRYVSGSWQASDKRVLQYV